MYPDPALPIMPDRGGRVETARTRRSEAMAEPYGNDPLALLGIDYVEFYVGNARQAAHFYRTGYGYEIVAYAGPETGVRDRASYLLGQGNVRLLLTTALTPEHPISQHV